MKNKQISRWDLDIFSKGSQGNFSLQLELDGDSISAVKADRGYLHRGIEKCFEKSLWFNVMPYADRIESETSVFNELALCLSVERLAEIEVPLRAQYIRIIVCELTRMTSHLKCLAKIAKACGADTATHFLMRDREKILDLFELLCGARFSLNYFRFGGVQSDLSEGFIERVVDLCDSIRLRLKEYNELLSYNFPFLERTAQVGCISKENIFKYGITGPIARASGVLSDVRRSRPYSLYNRIDFEVVHHALPVGINGGSIHDRFMVRLKEIYQSVSIISQLVDSLPAGSVKEVLIQQDFCVPEGESISLIESPRGEFGCYIMSDGSTSPQRIQFFTPSSKVFEILPEVLKNCTLDNFPAVVASLDLSLAEADR